MNTEQKTRNKSDSKVEKNGEISQNGSIDPLECFIKKLSYGREPTTSDLEERVKYTFSKIDEKKNTNANQEFIDVNDLEYGLEEEKRGVRSMEHSLLEVIKGKVEKMTDDLIQMAKVKLDNIEEAIEINIIEKIRQKIMLDVLEKGRTIVKDAFEQNSLDSEQMKKSMILAVEKEFQQYFIKVAGVYDLGLKYFREYCLESEIISNTNKQKNKLIHSELSALRSEDRNIIKELQSQAKDEFGEIKTMKDITEATQKCATKVGLIKERNQILEKYIFYLKHQLTQKEQNNAVLVDKIIKDTINSMICDESETDAIVQEGNELNDGEEIEISSGTDEDEDEDDDNDDDGDDYSTFTTFF